jgi:aspartate-semialdehyde dehydrogenase
VQELSEDAFDGVDIAVFDVPEEVAAQWAPVAAAKGAVVVDSSPAFRMDPQVPLVAAQVNPAQVRNRPRGIIASPGSATLTVIDALAALHAGWELTELVVCCYQAASDAGREGVQRLYDELDVVAGDRELGQQTGDVRAVVGDKLGERSPFAAPLAMNVVPWSGVPGPDGWSSEELAIRGEARKLLGIPSLRVSATAVRVPVVTAHSASVHAVFARPVKVQEARQALVEAPSVVVLDDPQAGEFPTPADVVGSDPTFVGRLRQSPDFPRTLEMFLCGDNLRRGSALNVTEIAELVARDLAHAAH